MVLDVTKDWRASHISVHILRSKKIKETQCRNVIVFYIGELCKVISHTSFFITALRRKNENKECAPQGGKRMSVENQKVVEIGARPKRDKNNLYAMVNLDALKEAMKNLKGSSMKMWMYFNKNQNGYKFDLSRADCLEWGIKKDSYYSAIADLIERGYLVPIREGSNHYMFYEVPLSENTKGVVKEDSEKENWFGENTNFISETQKDLSEKPERNNKNITRIKQDKTAVSKEEKAMYEDLDKLFLHERYVDPKDLEELGDLLINEYYWCIPEKRIAEMTRDERNRMRELHCKYYS